MGAKSRRRCCNFRRSDNDGLVDSDDGLEYCGTCWQAWVESRLDQSKERKPAAGSRSAAAQAGPGSIASHTREVFDDDDTVGALEGVSAQSGDGSTTLCLVSRNLSLVFQCERDDNGRLVRIGQLNEDGEVELDGQTRCDSADTAKFPFTPNPADHCETPFEAYQDLAPVLKFLSGALGKNPSSLRIYDPYYCDGAVRRHLDRLGLPHVHNVCEDFYETISRGELPDFDCLVTNPPYVPTAERDHVEALLHFVASRQKPWFIVQPNYVYTKPAWEDNIRKITTGPRPFFLTPPQPRSYVYTTPTGMRDVKSEARKTSPFATMWYCWMPANVTEKLFKWWPVNGRAQCQRLRLACTEFFLPDEFKDSADKTRRKKKNKKEVLQKQQLLGSTRVTKPSSRTSNTTNSRRDASGGSSKRRRKM